MPTGATFAPAVTRVPLSVPRHVLPDTRYQTSVRGNDNRCEGLWRGSRRTGAAVVRARGGRRGMARLPVRPRLEAPRAPGELAGPRHHRPRPHPRLVGAPALQHRHRLRPVRPRRHRPGRRPRRTRWTRRPERPAAAGTRRPRFRRGRPPAAVPGARSALPGGHLHRRHAVRGKPPVLHRPRDAGAELGRAARAAHRRPRRRRLRGRGRQPDRRTPLRRARRLPAAGAAAAGLDRATAAARSPRCPRSPGRCRPSTGRRAGPTPWPPSARRPAGSPRRGSGRGTTRSTGPRSASASWSRPG